jgi:hypothetical protein
MGVADSTHGHTSDNITLATDSTLVVDDSIHGHTSDEIGLIVVLSIDDSTYDHSSDLITLVSASAPDVADSTHGHTSDLITLTTLTTPDVIDSTDEHTSDNITLSTLMTLVVTDSSDDHTSDVISLSTQSVMSVDDSTHGHTSDNVAINKAWGVIRYWIGDGTSEDWFTTSNWTDEYVQLPGAPIPTIANDVYFNGGGVGDCTLTGSITCKRLLMDAATYTGLLDLVSYDAVIDSDVNAARVKMGSGSHTVGGDFKGPLAGTGQIDFEACTMTVPGDIDLRNAVTTNDSSAVTLEGTNDQALYNGGTVTSPNDFGDMIVEKTGGRATLYDDWYVANFSGVSGDFDFNGFIMKVGY